MDEEDHELVFIDTVKKRRSRAKNVCYCFGATVVVGLIIAVAVLAVVLGVVVARQYREEDKCPTVTTTCKKESCTELAKAVQANLDTAVDPCVDFYNFSCGGWVKNNPLPPGRGRYSPFSKLDEENMRQLIEIMNTTKDDDINAVVKVKKLYRSCTNISRINKVGADPLLQLIQNAGGWDILNGSGSGSGSGDDFSVEPFLDSDNFFRQKLEGSPAFFSIYVYVDDKDSSKYTLFLEQNGLTLSSPEQYAISNSSQVLLSALKEYIVSTLVLLNPNISQDIYEDAADDVLELEMELAEIFVSAVALRDPEATYNKMSIGQLSTAFPGTFNWTRVFQRSYELADAPAITTDDEVVVRTTSYFQNLSQILIDTGHVKIRNYAMWQYIKDYIPYLSEDFLSVYYNFTQTVTGSGERSRNETCMAVMQGAMPIALARPYTEFILPGGTKEAVTQMISQVKNAFKERVNDSTWLQDPTKLKCDEKVNAITQRVAYPDLIFHDSYVNGLYENYTIHDDELLLDLARVGYISTIKNLRQLHTEVDKTEWDIAPTAVNAYYNPSFNQFTFLEGILAPPFLKADWPNYFAYGAFGVVIGHELTHGFDDQGQQYDKDGNLRKWWDNASIAQFKERQTCFRNQYSDYKLYGVNVNGNLTLGENLADNGGLKTSYQAYRTLTQEEGEPPSLPGLKYTPDQLFFIAFAQVWCSDYTREYITTSLLTNPHSPGPYRVKGTLVNSQEFADAFQCPSSSAMNPKRKCLMW